MNTSVAPPAVADALVPLVPAGAADRLCTNCGAALIGPYCSECGQRHHDHPVHSLWHFVQEATEDLTHADSRLWRTLYALLLRPGLLTREFLDGRRARYLPPVRLYLVVSLLFFLIAGLSASLAPRATIHVVKNAKTFHYSVQPPTIRAGAPAANAAIVHPHQLCASTAAAGAQVSPWFAHRLEHSCLAVTAGGGIQRFGAVLGRNYERAMFLLLPLLALAMVPLYRRPRRYYVEHLLFLLHNHAFLFVLFGLVEIAAMLSASRAIAAPLSFLVSIAVPVYYYRALRRVYGQSRWRTLGKMTGLGVAYLLIGATVLASTVAYSFLSL
ncbi:MAG: DUF3667 domain-containing protein [Steroidobacteraceae bacterium]